VQRYLVRFRLVSPMRQHVGENNFGADAL